MKQDSKTFGVNQSASELYQQWSNFEGLSNLPGLKEIRKTGDRTAHVTFDLFGQEFEFDARITNMEENRRIEWTSTSGFENSGEVLLDPIGTDRTRVTINYSYQTPQESDEAREFAGSAGER